MIAPTVLRGFSDEYGSWKIICISRRSGFSCAALDVRDVAGRRSGSCRWSARAGASSSRAVVLLPQPVSPTMPSVSPRITSNDTPSTACTAPTCRWKMIPRVIGKCLTRSRTSISASLGATVSALRLDAARARPPGPCPARSSAQSCRRVVGLEQAGDEVAVLVGDRLELRLDLPVALAHVRTARMEGAAAGKGDQARRPTGDRHQRLVARAVEPGDRPQQAPGVRVLRAHAKIVVGRRLLDDLAGIHHGDLVGVLGDDAEIVRDQDDRHVELALKPRDQVEDLRLHRHVERGRGLVGDQHLGLVRQAPSRSSRAGASRRRTRAGSCPRGPRVRDPDQAAAARPRVSRPPTWTCPDASASPRRAASPTL